MFKYNTYCVFLLHILHPKRLTLHPQNKPHIWPHTPTPLHPKTNPNKARIWFLHLSGIFDLAAGPVSSPSFSSSPTQPHTLFLPLLPRSSPTHCRTHPPHTSSLQRPQHSLHLSPPFSGFLLRNNTYPSSPFGHLSNVF